MGRKILGVDWRQEMRFLNGKKGAVWKVCVPRINNRAERREGKAFSGVCVWSFSRAGFEDLGVAARRVRAAVSGARNLVIKMAFRPRVWNGDVRRRCNSYGKLMSLKRNKC